MTKEVEQYKPRFVSFKGDEGGFQKVIELSAYEYSTILQCRQIAEIEQAMKAYKFAQDVKKRIFYGKSLMLSKKKKNPDLVF